MDDVARLLALEEIRDLKYRYFRAVDTKDRALLLEVFHKHVEADFRGAGTDPATGESPAQGDFTEQVLHGAEFTVDSAMAIIVGTDTVHHGHNPEIHLTSETTARGIWAVMDLIRNRGDVVPKQLHGYGYYHETYEKVAGRWVIRTTKFVRTLIDVT